MLNIIIQLKNFNVKYNNSSNKNVKSSIIPFGKRQYDKDMLNHNEKNHIIHSIGIDMKISEINKRTYFL